VLAPQPPGRGPHPRQRPGLLPVRGVHGPFPRRPAVLREHPGGRQLQEAHVAVVRGAVGGERTDQHRRLREEPTQPTTRLSREEESIQPAAWAMPRDPPSPHRTSTGNADYRGTHAIPGLGSDATFPPTTLVTLLAPCPSPARLLSPHKPRHQTRPPEVTSRRRSRTSARRRAIGTRGTLRSPVFFLKS